MRVETEYVRVKKDVYVAFDGTRFDNETACKAYEVKNEDPLTIAADLIPHKIVLREWIDTYACESDLILIYFPTSYDELAIIHSWAIKAGCDFDLNAVPIGEPIMFDAFEFNESDSYGNDSIRGLTEIYSFLGTTTDLARHYRTLIKCMVNTARAELRGAS